MDRPTTGRVELAGLEIQSLSDAELAAVRRRDLGFVFQFFNLLPTLTVRENVALPLLLDGVARTKANERTQELLARVGLDGRASHFPAQLSGGEMQRVAIARALAPQPKLLIADEPTGSLDSENGQLILDLLAELHEEHRITVLLATHDEQVAAFASRKIRLRDGGIESEERRARSP